VRHDVDQATGLLKAELVGEEELEHRKKTQMVSCRVLCLCLLCVRVFVIVCVRGEVSCLLRENTEG
jgi:hypothetical protein